DFPAVLDAGDRDYFRSTRERTLGMSLEAACADPAGKLAAFQQACAPLERTLSAQPYICGPAPAYADYSVFSVFQWARLGSPKEVVTQGSAIADWRARMIALFGNLGDRFPGYPEKCETRAVQNRARAIVCCGSRTDLGLSRGERQLTSQFWTEHVQAQEGRGANSGGRPTTAAAMVAIAGARRNAFRLSGWDRLGDSPS